MTSLPIPPEWLRQVRVVIHWRGERASKEELLAIRHFLQEFRDRPISELLATFREAPHWSLGTMSWHCARARQREAEPIGLKIAIYETTDTTA
jgi:hypothetical protein